MTGPKRILIFSLNYYPYVGGAEVAIKEITDRIPPSEIEFHMIALRMDSALPKEEKIGNVMVHRIGFARPHPNMSDLKQFPLHLNKHLYQILAAYTACVLQTQYRFDGVWAMIAHSCAIPAGLFKICHPKVPYLLSLQEGDPPAYIEKLMRPVWPLFKAGFAKADYLQTISTFLLTWGQKMGFKGDAEVVPNGVDLARFAKEFSSEEQDAIKKKLHKNEGDIFLVTTSRLVHKNAVDDVIQALPLLPQHISFVVCGIGPDEDKLRILASDLKVAERVRFLGQVSHEDMPLILSVSDIFIRPSRSEGMGNSFIEAMAAGLPVIATQEGGISDFLFDATRNPDQASTGWAVDPNNPEQIARAVEDILKHPEHVEDVKETARNMVRSRYDWNLIAASMQRIFNQMLAKVH